MVPSVIFFDEHSHARIEFQGVFRRIQIVMLPHQDSEESFNEGIVCCPSFEIHGDFDTQFMQGTHQMFAGILCPLV